MALGSSIEWTEASATSIASIGCAACPRRRLDADVAAEFGDEASVNEALRLVARLRKVGVRRARKARRASAS